MPPAVTSARRTRPSRSALRAALDEDVVDRLPPLAEVLDPRRYLGEAEAVVDAAIGEWRTAVAGT